MATIRIDDRANEFRISLVGHFSGSCVQDVAHTWTAALAEDVSRRFTVDISGLTDYDSAGWKLLREMYHHGVQFAAATPVSLIFLGQISVPRLWSATVRPEYAADASVEVELEVDEKTKARNPRRLK